MLQIFSNNCHKLAGFSCDSVLIDFPLFCRLMLASTIFLSYLASLVTTYRCFYLSAIISFLLLKNIGRNTGGFLLEPEVGVFLDPDQ